MKTKDHGEESTNREIERKYLVRGNAWKPEWEKQHERGNATRARIRQGYLNLDPHRTVRVRMEDGAAILTVKGITVRSAKTEVEFENIDARKADELFKLCEGSLIEKTRYSLFQDRWRWEIDVFEGDNEGLVVAEIEFEREDERFPKPSWLGEAEDVPELPKNAASDHPALRFFNSSLAIRPYRDWMEEERSNPKARTQNQHP